MEENIKFGMDEVLKTFTNYSANETFDGVVVIKRIDGVVFNVGGKNDAFISKDEFNNFENVKVGERFKVVIKKGKTEDGMIIASKRKADELGLENQSVEKLKLGSKVSFVVLSVDKALKSKLGNFDIIVPLSEVSEKFVKDFNVLVSKRKEAIVTEIDKEKKLIVASIKMLETQSRDTNESNFWNAVFINKIVSGKVENIMPYGAFVNVDGVMCLAHISDLSYEKISEVKDVLETGNSYTFRIIKIDKENRKVSLGLKQLSESPVVKKIKELEIGSEFDGVVSKLLPFGAVILFADGLSGLLHITSATEDRSKSIHEIVRLNAHVKVRVTGKDADTKKISLEFVK